MRSKRTLSFALILILSCTTFFLYSIRGKKSTERTTTINQNYQQAEEVRSSITVLEVDTMQLNGSKKSHEFLHQEVPYEYFLYDAKKNKIDFLLGDNLGKEFYSKYN